MIIFQFVKGENNILSCIYTIFTYLKSIRISLEDLALQFALYNLAIILQLLVYYYGTDQFSIIALIK